MKFAAVAVLATVFALSDARWGGTKRYCKYIEDDSDWTSDRMKIWLWQKDSDVDPNPNTIEIGGKANNFDTDNDEALMLKSFDAADCTGTERTLSDEQRAFSKEKRGNT